MISNSPKNEDVADNMLKGHRCSTSTQPLPACDAYRTPLKTLKQSVSPSVVAKSIIQHPRRWSCSPDRERVWPKSVPKYASPTRKVFFSTVRSPLPASETYSFSVEDQLRRGGERKTEKRQRASNTPSSKLLNSDSKTQLDA